MAMRVWELHLSFVRWWARVCGFDMEAGPLVGLW